MNYENKRKSSKIKKFNIFKEKNVQSQANEKKCEVTEVKEIGKQIQACYMYLRGDS